MHLSELPQELILEIWHCLYDGISIGDLEHDASLCQSWLLNVLSTCMVCQSWYIAGLEYISIRLSSSSLSLTAVLGSIECPVSSSSAMELAWSRLLLESKNNKLGFHQSVSRLVLNLSGIYNPSWQQHDIKENESILALKQTSDIERFSVSIKNILTTCPNIKTVEILYGSEYTPIIGNMQPCQLLGLLSKSISEALLEHRSQHHHHQSPTTITTACSFLSHLVLTSREQPIKRCPCCAGRGWDHTLQPLLQELPVTTLELDHVLPSRPVLECLAQTRRIHTLVIRGDILIQASRLARYGASISTPPRIPLDLLSQIHTLEIYLHSNHDDGDEEEDLAGGGGDQQDALDLLAMFRQTYDIIHPIKSLQRLILHGREQFNIPLTTGTGTNGTAALVNNDVWNKLKLLAGRHQLKSFVLENIPGFRCPSVQSKLQNMFISVDKVNVVYST